MPEPVKVEREDVDVAGGKLACFHLGAPDRPAVVAVHGITANSRAWLPVARSLEDRAHLIALDLRGRGLSRSLPGPYGIDAHVRDVLAILDALALERIVLAGHSLGAYIVTRLAAAHPDRVKSLVLVDGGLPIPGGEAFDLDGFLGPALARLSLRFPDREAYRAWWREHPAFRGSDIADEDLSAYADHDLVEGEPGVGSAVEPGLGSSGAPGARSSAAPDLGSSVASDLWSSAASDLRSSVTPDPGLRSSVVEEAVRADAADLVKTADAAYRLEVPARLLCAPRGLLDDPNPMQPLALSRVWAARRPSLREAVLIPDVNHYTITLGARGAAAVADAIATACRERPS